MITCRFEGARLATLKGITETLRDANKKMAEAKKAVEASKEMLSKCLLEERGVILDELPIKEMVHIEGVVMIEIGSQNKFDQSSFMIAEPELFAKWKRDIPVIRFKPLV
jgi:hypothetical protein